MAAGRDARLVVWDFDWSLINDNSDTFAIEQLEGKKGPAWESGRAAQAVGEIAPGWTALMDRCVASLWDAGFRRENFAKVLSTISMLPGAVEVRMVLMVLHQQGSNPGNLSSTKCRFRHAILQSSWSLV